MKNLKLLLLAICALFGGASQSWAYSVNEITSAGWTKVTSLSDVDNYYYVLIDAASSEYAMGRLSYSTNRPIYMSIANPLGFAGMVWKLAEDGGNYTIKNLGDDKFFISGTQGWNDSMNDNQYDDEGRFTFTLNSGKYDIKSVKTGSYVGPWNNDNKVSLSSGYEDVAANKSASQAPGFYLYAMPRTTYDANRITASWLTSHGWSLVTGNEQLGNTSNYYLVIESVTFGYALARTSNGRPASKSLTNPFTITNELWILEPSGSGYKFKNAIDNTYFCSAAGDWNTSMGNHNADIIATLADGVYTLSAGGTSNIGHWGDNQFFPYENENVAANKNETNRNKYHIYTISQTDYATQRSAFLTSKAASATKDSPIDLSEFIVNNSDFGVMGSLGWTKSGSAGNQQTYNGAFETWNSNNVSITQELTGMPGGKYQLSVQMVSGDAGRVPYLYASADEEYTANVTQQATNNSYDGMKGEIAASADYGKLTVTPYSSNGTLTVGMKAQSGWVVFDNFKLLYYGPTVASSAIALPDGGAMSADTWYYFDIAVAGDNYNATATTLGDLVCVSEGNTLLEDATAGTVTLTATANTLAAQRYYVKSSSANNLVVAPASYTYTVGTATADKSYIQAGNTVTVSYADLVTSDPSASATIDFSGVTFGGEKITVTPTANGFTFTVPTVTAATDYTLAIPANAIGYAAGSTYNEAQNITLKTPAIFDGIYYFFNTDTQKYMSRGNTWGTQAITDDYGLPAYISFGADGKTKVSFFDTKLYLSDGGWLYADNATGGQFFVEAVAGGYKFKDATTAKYVALYNGFVVGDAVEGDNLQGTSNIWALETPAAYAAKGNATTLANAQAATAASAAGLVGITTLAALESELSANYGETAITITGAKAEKYNQNAWGDGGHDGALVENKYVEETVENLTPGIYRLTVDAFQRASSNDNVAAAGGASGLIYVYAGTAKTQVKSVMAYGADAAYSNDYAYDGKHYPNDETSAYTALETGNYKNTVYVYVADAGEGKGTLTFGINNPSKGATAWPNAPWAVYDNFTLTYFEAKPTAQQKQDLADAITAAEAKTLGFEKDEYAPYNNIAAIAALAAAKTVDPENASGAAVVAATTALTGATWTANAAEVNAFYKGDFAEYAEDTATPLDYTPNGWTPTANFRLMLANTETYPGLSDASATRAVMAWSGGITYGEQAGYEMPLTAHTIYELTFKCAGWDGQTRGNLTVNVKKGSEGLVNMNLGNASKDIAGKNAAAGLTSFNVVFETGEAGNYVFSISSPNNMVLTDFDLRKAVAEDITIAEDATYTPALKYANVTFNRTLVAGWNGLVLPFDMTADDVKTTFNASKVKTFDGIEFTEGNGVTLKFADAGNIEAGTPFLLKADAAGTSYTINNVILPANNLQDVEKADATADNVKYTMKGTYAATTTLDDVNFALIQVDKYFYHTAGVNSSSAKAFRAYFENNSTAPEAARVTFLFDDEVVTGISQIENAAVRMENTIFDLQGRKVEKAVKGLYIRNGKKVVIK